MDEEGFFKKSAKYTSKDIRYTRSKDNKTLYVTLLDWPETLSFSPEILQIDGKNNAKVELLDYTGELKYKVDNKKITVQLPSSKPGKYAYSFKLSGFESSLPPVAATNRRATIEGFKTNPPDKLRVVIKIKKRRPVKSILKRRNKR